MNAIFDYIGSKYQLLSFLEQSIQKSKLFIMI